MSNAYQESRVRATCRQELYSASVSCCREVRRVLRSSLAIHPPLDGVWNPKNAQDLPVGVPRAARISLISISWAGTPFLAPVIDPVTSVTTRPCRAERRTLVIVHKDMLGISNTDFMVKSNRLRFCLNSISTMCPSIRTSSPYSGRNWTAGSWFGACFVCIEIRV